AGALHDHVLVRHGGNVGAPGGAHAEDRRDLRDSLRGHDRLVVEDPAEVLLVREYLRLERQEDAARIHQVDRRQVVLHRDLLGPDTLTADAREGKRGEWARAPRGIALQMGSLRADERRDLEALGSEEPLSREKTTSAQRQADRKAMTLLGLVVLVLLGFAITVQTLWVSVVRSGFLGDNAPAGGWMLLVGLVGLTVLFCLYILHQQTEINRFRSRLMNEQMELEQSRGRLAELTSLFQLGNSLHMDLP